MQGFNKALREFEDHIKDEVTLFKEARQDAADGRRQLNAAIDEGHGLVREIAHHLHEAMTRLAAADAGLTEAVGQTESALRAELSSMGGSLRTVEAELQGVSARLSELVDVASGAPLNGQGTFPRGGR